MNLIDGEFYWVQFKITKKWIETLDNPNNLGHFEPLKEPEWMKEEVVRYSKGYFYICGSDETYDLEQLRVIKKVIRPKIIFPGLV